MHYAPIYRLSLVSDGRLPYENPLRQSSDVAKFSASPSTCRARAAAPTPLPGTSAADFGRIAIEQGIGRANLYRWAFHSLYATFPLLFSLASTHNQNQ
jgi:hypothetical protein